MLFAGTRVTRAYGFLLPRFAGNQPHPLGLSLNLAGTLRQLAARLNGAGLYHLSVLFAYLGGNPKMMGQVGPHEIREVVRTRLWNTVRIFTTKKKMRSAW